MARFEKKIDLKAAPGEEKIVVTYEGATNMRLAFGEHSILFVDGVAETTVDVFEQLTKAGYPVTR